MSSIHIKQIDAFTRKPFSGNPAGVVLDADNLSSTDMLHIANEMAVSETAFVLKSEDEECDLRMRWFTPTREVDLCGHATIAAFHAMAEEKRFGLTVNEPQSFLVETKSGILTVDVEWKDMQPYIKMGLPIPSFFPFPDDYSLLCAAIGISEVELSKKVKPQITQDGYCYIPLASYDSMKTIEPNFMLMKKIDERHDIKGFAVVTTDTGERDIDWHLRFFAPTLGVNEDPVTGSANGPMAVFLWHNELLDTSKKFYSFKGFQGYFMNRPGYVTVNMLIKDGKVDMLQIAGQAVTVLDGSIRTHLNIPEKL
ncbi:MAG: PhzF family phenazine biosynthesis isomerase [Balneolia bacterium]|nr:PhzF family phenazine biosynthesis isomerase [Balneolia bacterium]